jgi:hypothetical protein
MVRLSLVASTSRGNELKLFSFRMDQYLRRNRHLRGEGCQRDRRRCVVAEGRSGRLELIPTWTSQSANESGKTVARSRGSLSSGESKRAVGRDRADLCPRYSLGGLVARYVLGLLESRTPSFFTEVRPVNFTTFASPAIGMCVLPSLSLFSPRTR